jgi:hypothetical protein
MYPSPSDLLAALHQALHDEREGVRNLDLEAIQRANETKQNILWLLREMPKTVEDRQPLYDAVDSARTALQDNLVLMTKAHAEVRAIVAHRKQLRSEIRETNGSAPESASAIAPLKSSG